MQIINSNYLVFLIHFFLRRKELAENHEDSQGMHVCIVRKKINEDV